MRLWKVIDGRQTVGELAALGRLSAHETAALVWALRCAGLVELKDPNALPPPLPRRAPPPLKRRPTADTGGTLFPELSTAQERPTPVHHPEYERLAAHWASMRQQDHFKNLGISRNAAPADVKQAYAALSEVYGPSGRFASEAPEIRELAGRIHELLSAAHRTLSDPSTRAAYARKIASGSRAAGNGDVGKLVAAEGRFRKGQELMRNQRYVEAWEQFEEAIRLYPHEGDFHAWLGWAIFQSAPASQKAIAAALEYLDQALRLNPRGETGYLFAAYVHRAAGHPDLAREHFEKAVECNPECTEALQELRGGRQ
jgi:tetratricopeptide (TPR) repeat protein